MKNLRPLALLLPVVFGGCLDPSLKFYLKTEYFTAEEDRPRNWEELKRLVKRPVPKVGRPAPDFRLGLVDGEQIVTRSEYQAGRPLVLIFGSYT